MTNIEQIREKIQYAHTVSHSSTAIMREFLEAFRVRKNQINYDRNLSEIGKREQIATLQGHWERKAIEQAAEIKSIYQKTLAEARDAAEKLMLTDIPAVDDRTRKVFAMRSEELQSKIHFATNPVAAVDALEELVNAAEQPALAAEIRGKFMELSAAAIGLAGDQNEALMMRKTLGQLYDRLASNAMTDEARAAAEIVQQVDAMRNADIFSLPVENAFQEISKLTRQYLNDSESYFEKYGGGSND